MSADGAIFDGFYFRRKSLGRLELRRFMDLPGLVAGFDVLTGRAYLVEPMPCCDGDWRQFK